MTPELSRRAGAALAEHWVTYDERESVVAAVDDANRWADLPADIRQLISDIEARGLVRDGVPPNAILAQVEDEPTNRLPMLVNRTRERRRK